MKSVGKDSTTGILVNGDAVRFSVGRPVPEEEDLFDHNEKLKAQICFCVDATDLDSLGFQFDIRLTYSNYIQDRFDYEQPPTSAMRIMIDGVEDSRYLPATNNEDDWETHNIDLESKLGSSFTLCLETRTIVSKLTSRDTIGDHVYLDNIGFVSSRIETATHDIERALPIAIYPNPTTTSTFIEFDAVASGQSDILVRNINGQIMSKRTSRLSEGMNTIELDLNNFEAGIYFIEVRTEHDLHLGKVVVQ
jgi:hypothetical protein